MNKVTNIEQQVSELNEEAQRVISETRLTIMQTEISRLFSRKAQNGARQEVRRASRLRAEARSRRLSTD